MPWTPGKTKMAAAMESKTKIQEVKELMAKKDGIESEIKELSDLLQSQGGVGMDGPLIDEELYPRSDIDIYSVRHARHRIICLQNDHKELMKEIEEGLYQVHAAAKGEHAESMEIEPVCPGRVTTFAYVDLVDEGSPAQAAGLEKCDELVEFGSVTAQNFVNLQNIATIVQHSVGKPIKITVLRKEEMVKLTLTPNTWSGRGFLGCKIVPGEKVSMPER
ncbi:26S proteasome non-ATPase regulatory subunit 9-like [Lineus longissimus]|uniref:26S proteasome non-ATPase regulatory subunit 9-like n=1 Tax=Lineus longissimus TaxID=88925 RepID=UPI002B4CF2D0